MTNVLAFRAIELGQFALNTRVSEIIPEFSGGVRETINFFHLLTHTSGLPAVWIPKPGMYIDRLDEIIEAFWPTVNGSWSGNVNQISRASGVGSDLRAIEARTDLNINEAEFSDHPLFLKLAELFQTEDLHQLRFSQVTARILTSQGVANIKRLHLIGPILQAEGDGTAGLIDKKIDLRLNLQIQPQYVGKIAALRELVPKISNAQGFVRLPLTVKGTFDEPVYGLDEAWLAQLTTELAEESAKEPKVKVPPTPVLKDIDIILKGSNESKLAEEPKKPKE